MTPGCSQEPEFVGTFTSGMPPLLSDETKVEDTLVGRGFAQRGAPLITRTAAHKGDPKRRTVGTR